MKRQERVYITVALWGQIENEQFIFQLLTQLYSERRQGRVRGMHAYSLDHHEAQQIIQIQFFRTQWGNLCLQRDKPIPKKWWFRLWADL